MTVSELINELSRFDGYLKVEFYHIELDQIIDNVEDIVEEVVFTKNDEYPVVTIEIK